MQTSARIENNVHSHLNHRRLLYVFGRQFITHLLRMYQVCLYAVIFTANEHTHVLLIGPPRPWTKVLVIYLHIISVNDSATNTVRHNA